jgi:predicted cupin superfamily sugar epimerase
VSGASHLALIARLQLEAHPEGGWYRRIFTSERNMDAGGTQRPLAKSIYYLLGGHQRHGRLHGNRSDILHFLIDGGPVEYLHVAPGGALQRTRLQADGNRHLLVPGGCWKASQLDNDAAFALVAEVVTPGFDYADHRFATGEDIARDAPDHRAVLEPFLRRD